MLKQQQLRSIQFRHRDGTAFGIEKLDLVNIRRQHLNHGADLPCHQSLFGLVHEERYDIKSFERRLWHDSDYTTSLVTRSTACPTKSSPPSTGPFCPMNNSSPRKSRKRVTNWRR